MIKGAAWGAILVVLLSTSLFAQSPGIGYGLGYGPGKRGCSDAEAIGLSEAQREALLKIDQRYKELLLMKRNDQMVKRIELQAILRDPDAKESNFRQKSLEIGTLQNEIREEMIEYQIEIRKILTADQIRRWCTLVGVGLSRQEW